MVCGGGCYVPVSALFSLSVFFSISCLFISPLSFRFLFVSAFSFFSLPCLSYLPVSSLCRGRGNFRGGSAFSFFSLSICLCLLSILLPFAFLISRFLLCEERGKILEGVIVKIGVIVKVTDLEREGIILALAKKILNGKI